MSMGILQARILEWVVIPPPGDLPNPGIEPRSPTLQVDSLPAELQGSPRILEWVAYPFFRGSFDLGIKPGSPALQADSLPTELSGKPHIKVKTHTEKGMTIRFKKISSLSFSLPNLH